MRTATGAISAPSAERQQQAARLGDNCGQLGCRLGIGDDAGARAETHPDALHLQRAEQNIEVETDVAVEITHRPGVRTAWRPFEFSDDYHAAHHGAAGD